MSTLPSLTDFGAPPKFSLWRPGQSSAIERLVDTPCRIVAACCPTGFGKSAVAIGRAVMTGVRAVYLTSTKGLQEQLEHDFTSIGLTDVRGQDNYQCIKAPDFGTKSYVPVSRAPCHAGITCPLKNSTCTYYAAVRNARQGELVSTNYAYWILQNYYGEGLGAFDLMICDEAHEIVEAVCSVLSTTIMRFEVEAVLKSAFPNPKAGVEKWKHWAGALAYKLDKEITEVKGAVQSYMESGDYDTAHQFSKRLYDRKELKRRLDVLATAKGEWVAEMSSNSMQFDPIWPQEYVEEMLFRHTPHVVLMSATVRPKTLDLLGVEDYEFVEYPSTFPLAHRPVYRVPTVRLNKDTTEEGYRTWVTRIDQIIRDRLDRKGIIHTVSYARAKLLLERSEYRHHMVSHNSKTTRSTVEQFRKADPPCILVSPSMDTGWDFPDSQCRWMVIGKLPWPDTRSAIIRARKEKDPDYMSYLTMQALVQMAGRGVRSEQDWCEVLVVDDSLGWFLKQHSDFAPDWFRQAIRWVQTIPEPLDP